MEGSGLIGFILVVKIVTKYLSGGLNRVICVTIRLEGFSYNNCFQNNDICPIKYFVFD